MRLRLTVRPDAVGSIAEEMGRQYALEKVEAGAMDFLCNGADKMSIVRRVAKLNGVVNDVDIQAPRLEDLYAHFVAEGEGA